MNKPQRITELFNLAPSSLQTELNSKNPDENFIKEIELAVRAEFSSDEQTMRDAGNRLQDLYVDIINYMHRKNIPCYSEGPSQISTFLSMELNGMSVPERVCNLLASLMWSYSTDLISMADRIMHASR